MHPTLFTLGSMVVSSFGFFLALAFILAVFTSWRLARIYDLSEEKILDLCILTFFGGLLGARILFVAFNPSLFDSLDKILFLNRYPGLSFWGGLLGGSLTFWFFLRRTKFSFWQVADFASVSLLLGIALGDIGCFLGGCAYGQVSSSFPAFPVVGVVGKRIPVSLFEAIAVFLIFLRLFPAVVKFHFPGKIVALSLIFLGLVKLTTQNWRGDSQFLPFIWGAPLGYFLSLSLIIFGLWVFYHQSKRNILLDLKAGAGVLFSSRGQQALLLSWQKKWYNYQILWQLRLKKIAKVRENLPKILKRRLNVRATPKDIIES